MEIEPFRIAVPDEVLTDLKERLARTRWSDEIPATGWEQGTNLAYLRSLVEYWQTRFDWRSQEAAINAFPQVRANIQGNGVHFIHQPGEGPSPLPLLLIHGWPGSFYELYKIIRPLANPASFGGDPADAFHVVVPSLPGFGFSDRPQEPGMNITRIADLFAELMVEGLGYRRLGSQGGDWGAVVTRRLGFAYPDHVIGIHLSVVAGQRPLGQDSPELSEEERAWRRE